MTVTLFITMLTFGAGVSSLLTEAVKKAYANAHKEYSANIVALINAIVVGCGGTAVLYMLKSIPWTVNNIICLVLIIYNPKNINMINNKIERSKNNKLN